MNLNIFMDPLSIRIALVLTFLLLYLEKKDSLIVFQIVLVHGKGGKKNNLYIHLDKLWGNYELMMATS